MQKSVNNQTIPYKKLPWNRDTFSKIMKPFSNLSVAIVSQKYQEWSLQVENGE
jgi:hypothetical protein